MSQGVVFGVSHCCTGCLSWVAWSLGVMSFVATWLPIVVLLRTSSCRQGLRLAHWPVAEALPGMRGVNGEEKAGGGCDSDGETCGVNGEEKVGGHHCEHSDFSCDGHSDFSFH